MFAHRFRYLFIFALSLYTLGNTILCDVYEHFNIGVKWYYCLLTIFGITFFTWEGNRLIEPILFKRTPTSHHHTRFIVYFFVAGNLVTCLSVFTMVFIVGTLIHGYGWRQNFNPLKLNIIYGILVNLFFHLVNTILLFFREKEKFWKQAEELRKISAQAEIQQFKSQINPHFLFNNLNVLSAMVIKHNPEANTFIEEFSRVYRHVLKNQEKELVLLSTELEFIDSYVFLLKKRFTDALKVDINISDHHKNLYVVPAALQMLIENAIKHNIVSRAKPLLISINVNQNNNLTVSNNLQRRRLDDTTTRIGLQNIDKRYRIISGKKITIVSDAQNFTVTIPLLEKKYENEGSYN